MSILVASFTIVCAATSHSQQPGRHTTEIDAKGHQLQQIQLTRNARHTTVRSTSQRNSKLVRHNAIRSTAGRSSISSELAELGRRSSNETICSFQAFLQNEKRTVVASANNVIFASNDVMVVQVGPARILAFITPGTFSNWWTPSCGEQAIVECGVESEALSPMHYEATGKACEKQRACAPRAEPDLSCARSMLGGALTARKGKLENIAVIGLGAGMIPLWLAKMIPTALVEAVDISADVIAAAPCFGLQSSTKLQLVNEDGRKYLSLQPNRKYDVIFVDVFAGQEATIPPDFKTVEFYSSVSKRLAPGGVLTLNVNPHEAPTVKSALLRAFPSNCSVQVGEAPGLSNVLILARAPGGSEHHDIQVERGNGAGMAVAQKWASEANFKELWF